MSRKLLVSNLSASFDNEDLDRLFTAYGTVRLAEVFVDLRTGASTGSGVVEMESDSQGDAAIAALDGIRCCDRILEVGWSTASATTHSGQPGAHVPVNLHADVRANAPSELVRLPAGPH